MKARLKHSLALVGGLWFVPILYVAMTMAIGWNCRQKCLCLSECFPKNLGLKKDHRCSRFLPPMTNLWLIVIVISWTVCFIATIISLYRLQFVQVFSCVVMTLDATSTVEQKFWNPKFIRLLAGTNNKHGTANNRSFLSGTKVLQLKQTV